MICHKCTEALNTRKWYLEQTFDGIEHTTYYSYIFDFFATLIAFSMQPVASFNFSYKTKAIRQLTDVTIPSHDRRWGRCSEPCRIELYNEIG